MAATVRFETYEPAFSGFEWDETKQRRNIEKHGLSFVDVLPIFDQIVGRRASDRDGESRYLVVGVLGNVEISVIYTQREENICRIISARRARVEERRAYRALHARRD